jgi:hypothetical protein
MLSWRERKRITEEEELRRSLVRQENSSWGRRAITIVNSPIVLAVVVSSVLGFLTATFNRSETCFADLANANHYWDMLDAELIIRLDLKMTASNKASNDIGDVIHTFASTDIQEQDHVNSVFKGTTFVELLLNFDAIRGAFSLPVPPKEQQILVMLPELNVLLQKNGVSTAGNARESAIRPDR